VFCFVLFCFGIFLLYYTMQWLGDDISIDVEVPFMTSIFGGQEVVRVRRAEACGTCSGSGLKAGAKAKKCSKCGGQGMVNNMQRTSFGVFNSVQPCPACKGAGEDSADFCPTCKGACVAMEHKEVQLKIPAGVEAGTTLRVKEAGCAGKKGGRRGDLYVQMKVKNHPKFRRDGADILTEEGVSYVHAILGTTLQVDTVHGKVDVKIPPGTQPDQKLRLKGKGAPRYGSQQTGDAFITVKVRIPSRVSDREKELVEALAAEEAGTRSGDNKETRGTFDNAA
jgi:molecular chaperone DnaJ